MRKIWPYTGFRQAHFMRSHLPCFDEEVNAVSIRSFGSSGYLLKVTAQAASDLALTSSAFLSQLLASLPCFLSCPHSVSRNRQLVFPWQISHKKTQLMSKFLKMLSTLSRPQGSPSSGSANIAMCPPVGDAAGDGFISTGVPAGPSASLEVFLRELAVRQNERFTILPNQIADIQRHAP